MLRLKSQFSPLELVFFFSCAYFLRFSIQQEFIFLGAFSFLAWWMKEKWRSLFLFLMFVAQLYHCFMHWTRANNHDFLAAYWILALFCALFFVKEKHRRSEFLQKESSLLLGLLMVVATFQKILSPDYRSGSLMLFFLLGDKRAFYLSELLAPSMRKTLLYNYQLISNQSLFADHPLLLHSSPLLERWVPIMTWGTLALEALMGACFFLTLFSLKWAYYLGHMILLLFCLTLYQCVPIYNFGFLLALMGLGAVKDDFAQAKLLQQGYLMVIFVLLIRSALRGYWQLDL